MLIRPEVLGVREGYEPSKLKAKLIRSLEGELDAALVQVQDEAWFQKSAQDPWSEESNRRPYKGNIRRVRLERIPSTESRRYEKEFCWNKPYKVALGFTLWMRLTVEAAKAQKVTLDLQLLRDFKLNKSLDRSSFIKAGSALS